MITTLPELEDATEFERVALSMGFPLMPIPATVAQASLDLRNSTSTVTIGVMSAGSLEGQARQDLINQLRPLFFGAAWKILDLVMEFAFFAEGHRPHRSAEWRITEKQDLAKRHRGQCQPWIAHSDIWE